MTQKIKLIRPLRDLVYSPQIQIPEKFFGFRDKFISLFFTLFYVKHLGERSFTLNEQNKRSLKPGILSHLVLSKCHKNVDCAADVIEKDLKEYVQRENVVYMIKLSAVEIKVGLGNSWRCQPSLLIYHYELN